MRICVRDLSGTGRKHDPLSVSYIVTGGKLYTLTNSVTSLKGHSTRFMKEKGKCKHGFYLQNVGLKVLS